MSESNDPIEIINEEIARIINKQVLLDIAEQPLTKLINVDKVEIDDIKNWLRQSRSVTWSIYSISSEDTLDKAARWFKDQLDSFVSSIYSHP